MSLSDAASIATIAAFLVTLISIAFSARRFIIIREKEQESQRFTTYHRLIKTISKGSDEEGVLKLASQLAYIYELRNFPEYSDLTENLLNRLRVQWSKNEAGDTLEQLKEAIDDTLAYIQQKK